ncbi:mutT/NUDIX family protein [Halosimplex carlsbadense 2-9-1]|uniref:MutT/NUDIX family protein n=1 Tax=Halosimplex carlsbadense 2-9-1 TaxID=797114 RepID=M0CUW7_9EURY|nr:NUDIX domain-containing protein [Halosimplex carlsbadense]ELZ25689.1 mutT/NUDIX family protein [Halosimplex carlsbadense 2-9-1]
MDEYAHVVNVDGAVARARDDGSTEYLLVERSAEEDHAAGLLGLPGGKLEPEPGIDHAVEATVRREIEEEVGVVVGEVAYVCSGTFETDTGHQCLNVVTLCAYDGGDARPREPEEVAAVHWLTMDEIRAREDVPAFTETYVERAAAVRDSK